MEIFPVTTVDEILAGLGYLIQANYEVLALLLATIIAIVFVVRWFNSTAMAINFWWVEDDDHNGMHRRFGRKK